MYQVETVVVVVVEVGTGVVLKDLVLVVPMGVVVDVVDVEDVVVVVVVEVDTVVVLEDLVVVVTMGVVVDVVDAVDVVLVVAVTDVVATEVRLVVEVVVVLDIRSPSHWYSA